MICGPDNILNHVCYEIGAKQLIRDGYLCPLISKAGVQRADTTGLHIRAGEFVADEVEALMDRDKLVNAACAEIMGLVDGVALRGSVMWMQRDRCIWRRAGWRAVGRGTKKVGGGWDRGGAASRWERPVAAVGRVAGVCGPRRRAILGHAV